MNVVVFLVVCLRFQFFIRVYVKLADRVKRIMCMCIRVRSEIGIAIIVLCTLTAFVHTVCRFTFIYFSAMCQSVFILIHMNCVTHKHFTNPPQYTTKKIKEKNYVI